MKIKNFGRLAFTFAFLFQPALIYAIDDPRKELEALYEKSNEVLISEPQNLVSNFDLLIPKIDFSASERVSFRIMMVKNINRKLLFWINKNDMDSLALEPKILQLATLLLEKSQSHIDKDWVFIPVSTNSIAMGYGADSPEEAHLSEEQKKAFKQAKVRQYYSDSHAAEQVKTLKNQQQVGLRALREDVIRSIATLRGRGVSDWNEEEFLRLYGKDPECERIIKSIFE